MKLFRKKNGMLTIIVNDDEINKKIASLILDAENHVRDLEQSLKSKDFMEKDEEIEELITLLEKILEQAHVLKEDVELMMLREPKEKKYVKIGAEQWFKDKQEQLESMKMAIDHLLELLREHPSIKGLKQGILDELFVRINNVIDSFNKIRVDDNRLKALCEKNA